MSEPPLVTIGIPTYNRASSYLRLAVESALGQTYRTLEIVVSDNCSTDSTAAVVASYSDARLRYFRQPTPLVPNDNFNFCLREARGRYFVMLHDDDLLDLDFVEKCMTSVDRRTDVGIICCGTRVIDARGAVIYEAQNTAAGLSTDDFFLAWFAGAVPLFPCSTLYNAQKLVEIGGFHSRHNLFQDCAATFAMVAKFGRVDVLEAKASYRVHAGELTHLAKVQDWCEDSLELLDSMCELASLKKAEIRTRGERFFADFNYQRASKVEKLRGRVSAFALVARAFGYRYWPSFRLVLAGTALYGALRTIKRRALGRAEWVE